VNKDNAITQGSGDPIVVYETTMTPVTTEPKKRRKKKTSKHTVNNVVQAMVEHLRTTGVEYTIRSLCERFPGVREDTVRKRMNLLVAAGTVSTRRDGLVMWYSTTPGRSPAPRVSAVSPAKPKPVKKAMNVQVFDDHVRISLDDFQKILSHIGEDS